MSAFDQFIARVSYGGFFDPLRWAVVIWLFTFGACAGSFMNVVIWRLPLGRSLTLPGSRCPNCGHAVRAWDNIPILNWFILRGRCRDCGAPISWRYPAVETLVASLFVLIALIEPLTQGANLPGPSRAASFEFRELLPVWILYAEQMLLLCTLICAAFMWFDGATPPERLFAPMGLIGLFAPLILPELRPEQLLDSFGRMAPRLVVASESVLGLALAAVLGTVAAYGLYPGRNKLPVTQAVWETAICALVFGVPATARIFALAALLYFLATLAQSVIRFLAYVPWTAYVITAVVVQIATWRFMAQWPGLATGWYDTAVVLGAVLIVAILSVVTKRLRGNQVLPAAGWNRDWPVQRRSTAMEPAKYSEAIEAIVKSPSYKLAELDTDFLQRSELQPVRLQLELLKPEMTLSENGVQSTIVAFGGTQIVEHDEAVRRLETARAAAAESPDDPALQRAVQRLERLLEKSVYYDAAREFARLASQACQDDDRCEFVIVTGGGPGIMEAANRGAHDVGAKSIGLNITLPEEQFPNPYITPELCFQFHYFAIRKLHLVMRAKALVVFPGGFGTLDELFEVLTLRQTKRMQAIPIILFGRDYWRKVFDAQFLADEGVIADEHLGLLSYAETPKEAWEIICRFHGIW